ncbi:MAG: GDSL-type esterase/lipase family protein [Candidatus Moraniibacteriota bacterium]
MKRNLLIAAFVTVIILGVGLVWYLWRSNAPVKNQPLKPQSQLSLVAVGDSLVEGQGATAGHDFVSLLSQKIGVTIENEGVSGDTSAQVLARIAHIAAEKPDIAILLVGGNDTLRRIPPEETFRNIAMIIETLQKEGSAVVLVGIQGGLFGDRYRKEFDALAEKYQTAYVPDILDGIIGNRSLMSDSVHPNDQGYVLVADKIYREMEKRLLSY